MPPKKSNGTALTASNLTVYTYSHRLNLWNTNYRQTRDFENIFIPNKLNFIRDLNTFLNIDRENWYKEHNIPYRRGYFLYGPPGTGKTSIAYAVATYARRPIYLMPPDMNIDAVTQIAPNAVILLEDADKLIMSDDTKMRMTDPEPVSETTKFPNINPEEHHIWLKAIRMSEKFIADYNSNYKGVMANMDGEYSAIEAMSEGILNDMKEGYCKPKASIFSTHGGQGGAIIETTPAETDEEYKERCDHYKLITDTPSICPFHESHESHQCF